MENVKEKNEFINFEKALEIVKDLSKSQGFYGRLLAKMKQFNEEQKELFEQDLADKKVKDSMDLIFYFEC